jgi:Helicase conserved C-terminal domain
VAQLVVVSADVVVTAQFSNYVDSLRARQLLRGIFVDECHTIIMDVSYRQKLAALKGLHRFDCPVVVLTATLPGMMERWFRQAMLVEDALIVRASTVKRNIRYNVVRVTTKGGFTAAQSAVDDEVVRVMLRMEKDMTGDQKGVIYCRSRPACERIAAKVGCDFYHSGIVDTQERQRRLGCWVTGTGGNRWIVATTGLGTGIDIPGIVGVIHMEQPYGLVDFIQQTGRGGRRAGETVESVIVMDQKKARMEETRSDVEQWNHQAMEWFVESVGCRRVPLGTFMDVGVEGCGADCEALQCELCDQCRQKQVRQDEEDQKGEEDEEDGEEDTDDVSDDSGSSSPNRGVSGRSVSIDTGSGINRYGVHIQEKHSGLKVLRQWLHEVGDDCAVCFVAWREQGGTAAWRGKAVHRIQECPRFAFTQYVAWRQQIRFAKFQCCVWCGLPQSFCRGWDPLQRCEQEDKVMPLVLWVLTQPRWRARVTMEFRSEISSGGGRLEEEGYIQWVQRSRKMYDEDMTNALAVWDMVVQDVSAVL